jgi:hypothetical protein
MIKTTNNKYKKFVVMLRRCSLNITIMASLLIIFVFLGATSYLYMQSPSTIDPGKESTIAYRQALEESFRGKNTQQEWKRLSKYHGNPTAVIYEEGKTPYFYDKQGNKCAFVPQTKGTETNNQPSADSEYSVALMLDQQPVIE